ncbi:hypothetical protein [Hyalangium gracile]|uniref:hypothetical protein n=1 Tax=Hyalangium gracile TaxID=394092 RepID=UPI001CC93CCF|nr:hypothetical protein [Hyalangium gracile]
MTHHDTEGGEDPMVGLWDIMTLMSGCSVLAGALAAARVEGGGVARTGMAVVLGLVMGFLSIVAVRMACERLLRTLPPDDGSQKTPPGLLLTFLALAVWTLGLGPFLSMLVARGLIRFAFS